MNNSTLGKEFPRFARRRSSRARCARLFSAGRIPPYGRTEFLRQFFDINSCGYFVMCRASRRVERVEKFGDASTSLTRTQACHWVIVTLLGAADSGIVGQRVAERSHDIKNA
jgi:hypothetical protein